MPVLPLVLGWLVLAAGPTPHDPSGYLPTGSAVELHDLGRLALLRDPGVSVLRFGPEGDTRPRPAADGTTILASTEGAGVIQRLWFAPIAPGPPAPWQSKNQHLRIHFGNARTPVLDVSLNDLFAGKHPHFPRPLAGECAGGFVCYVPVPFRDGCTVSIGGRDEYRYQLDVRKLPTAEGLTPFTETPTEAEAAALRLARALWLEPQALSSDEPSFSRNVEWRALSLRKLADESRFDVEGGARSTQLFALPAGPRTIRSLEAVPTPKTAEAWRSARLRLVWDDDDRAEAGVDLPLGLAFGQAERAPPYRSLLVGRNEMTWYNQFPMPYRRQALLQIDSDEPIKGVIRVRTLAGVETHAGYFRASVRSSSGAGFEWLNERGRGHLAGSFFEIQGRGDSPRAAGREVRLRADDRPESHPADLGHWCNGSWPGLEGALTVPQTFPLTGFSAYRHEGDSSYAAAYRWQLTDPVLFARSIAASIEPVAVNSFAAGDRAAVFWYSERPGPARARPRGGDADAGP